MTALASVSQCRTLTHLYLFKMKTEDSAVLKIYDLSQTCLSKLPFSFAQLGVAPFTLADPSKLLEMIRQKNLLPSESVPSTPTVEDCLKEIEQIITQVKPKILFENKELEKFTCPLTLEVFKDPVMDNHGHTFEKSAIEKHLKIKNECPLSRQPINSLTPNRTVQQVIEESQSQDPIPTLALFKKQNTQLAGSSLKMAQAFIDAEEYEEALSAYAKTFQYTKEWKDYQQLPLLFEKMGQKDKAYLAYLYLIQYQLQDKKVQEALQTVEQCRKSNPELIQISLLLIQLYRCTQQTSQAITFALEIGDALAQEHPQQALLVYRQILAEDPYQFKLYTLLAPLLEDPREKAHLLLKGACHAIQKKEYRLAHDFCEQAERLYEDSWIDRLIDLDLLSKQGIPTQEKLLHIAGIYEKKNLPSLMIKAYRMLIDLTYDPSYYEKIITAYDQIQKPKKALQWTLSWLKLLLEKQAWEPAEKVALQALKRTPQKIPLYEQLETIYTHWHGHALNNLWGQLGQAYLQAGQVEAAEKTYQKAFKQFNSFEHAMALADTLLQQDKKVLGVQTYYQASSLALLESQVEAINLCVKNIRQADPQLVHLKLSQRMHLLTQSRLLELSQELQSTKKELNSTKNELKETQNELKVLKEKVDPTLPDIAFGKKQWQTYFGDVGAEPPLPANIHQILNAPCPIWQGKKVYKTHLLVLVPQTVNGQPLTLKTLGELVKKPLQGHATQYSYFNLGEYTDLPTAASHWALMSRDVIPGSRKKTYANQKKLVQGYAGYELPKVLDAAVAVLGEAVRTGTRLYGDSPQTYTRCQEMYNSKDGWPMAVGCFAPGGLRVGVYLGVEFEFFGVGVCRKL